MLRPLIQNLEHNRQADGNDHKGSQPRRETGNAQKQPGNGTPDIKYDHDQHCHKVDNEIHYGRDKCTDGIEKRKQSTTPFKTVITDRKEGNGKRQAETDGNIQGLKARINAG